MVLCVSQRHRSSIATEVHVYTALYQTKAPLIHRNSFSSYLKYLFHAKHIKITSFQNIITLKHREWNWLSQQPNSQSQLSNS